MIALSNSQLARLQEAAGQLPESRQQDFIDQAVAYLEIRGDYDDFAGGDAFDRAIDLPPARSGPACEWAVAYLGRTGCGGPSSA
jgi:hypothetical protein